MRTFCFEFDPYTYRIPTLHEDFLFALKVEKLRLAIARLHRITIIQYSSNTGVVYRVPSNTIRV